VAAVALLASLVVALFAGLFFATIVFLDGGGGNLPALLVKMAEVLDSARDSLPAWLAGLVPAGPDDVKDSLVHWVRGHSRDVGTWSADVLRVVAHVLIGMVLGAVVALREVLPDEPPRPFAAALLDRATRLASAFRRVVFAQVRIAAINTAFTALYLAVLLPAFGVHLPFRKTLVAIVFITGLLPVVGNLIGNAAIVIVSLSTSFQVALGSLAFLLVIHKLEYFLNARIVGTRIHARAWELIAAMVAMEAAFGLAGLVAAPIYYAYLKDELGARALV
jgi:predicted PurR-regulated permease PerM